MAGSTPPPDSVVPTSEPAAPETPPLPPRASWWVWLGRDAVSTALLFFLYFYMFTLLSRDLVPRDRLWAGAWAVVGGCQLFFVLCVALQRRLPWLWPFVKRAAIVLFVVWHLFFLVFRNPLETFAGQAGQKRMVRSKQGWWKEVRPYYDKTDRATRKCGNLFRHRAGAGRCSRRRWRDLRPGSSTPEIAFDDDGGETSPPTTSRT